jgi:mutator protein MutT
MSDALEVAVAVVQRGDRVLICQRLPDASFAHFWEFPGGKRDPGESIEECLHRELGEEVALRIIIRDPLPVIDQTYPNVHLRLFGFWCEPANASDEPVPLQCQSLRWVTADELLKYRLPSASAPLIEAVRRRLVSPDGANP